MFALLKFVIWLVGSLVVLTFLLNFFGYRFDWHYLGDRRAACTTQLSACAQNLLYGGTKPEACKLTCMETEKLLIKTK